MKPNRPALLDGGIGAVLGARGVPSSDQAWTAHANLTHPDDVRAVHAAYAHAGARWHTANTFRTRPANLPDTWKDSLANAVSLCRQAIPRDHKVLGSLAPHDDCYTPHTAPEQTRDDHRRVAAALAQAGVDAILCETFVRASEAWVATEEAVRVGVPVWTALCPGVDGHQLSPIALRLAAEGALHRGAVRVLVNCVDARKALPYVEALRGLPFGVYANAGPVASGVGWGRPDGPRDYARLAQDWMEHGAQVIGGCCGTDPTHTAQLYRLLRTRYPLGPESS